MTLWALLLGAIGAEVAGTLALRASDGLTRWVPAVIVAVGYGTSFFLMSRVLRHLSVGVVYAVWSGVGVVAVAVLGWLLFGDRLAPTALAGIVLVIAGVLLIEASGGTHG